MIFTEEYASRITRALGLAPYATWIETFEGTDALVIERYDRDDAVPGRRRHQEDFNQVLGASGAEKYQEHGSKVSLGRVASVVASAEGPGGLARLLTLVTLAVAVGNLDMHAKNISLLHLSDGSSRLAPAYDVVPLTHYPCIDGRMAMAINDVYEHARIRRSDLIAEAGRWGMGTVRAGEVVDAAVATIRSTLRQEEPPRTSSAGAAGAHRLAGGPIVCHRAVTFASSSAWRSRRKPRQGQEIPVAATRVQPRNSTRHCLTPRDVA
jgi:serine/threonine-protein kinase HipA